MKTLLILLIIALEAIVDGLIYLSWTKHIDGTYHHIAQLFLLGSCVWFGSTLNRTTLKQFLCLLLAGAMLHFGFFDFIYGNITGNWVGSNSLADKVYNALPILNHVFVRFGVAFVGIWILTKTQKE